MSGHACACGGRGAFAALVLAFGAVSASAQSLGTAGTITGIVVDPSSAVVAAAAIELRSEVTQYQRRDSTDDQGRFAFSNIPPGVYRLVVVAAAFDTWSQTVSVRSNVPIAVRAALTVSGLSASVDVSAPPLVENLAVSHAPITENVFSRVPTASVASGLSDLVTLATPAVAADSNGFFHPLGDHALTNLTIDNQPITDQQGALFSTQLPPAAVESLDVLYGMIPAEYGDKTSLVINAITRSGLGRKAHGTLSASYGSQATWQPSATLGAGTARLGSFATVGLSRSRRFLDAPETEALHDTGHNVNVFDRVDYKPTDADALHLNLFWARSAFDIPNTYTQQASGQDQRQRVRSFNVAPGWLRILSPTTLLAVNPYLRRDLVRYFPSGDPEADQPATITQHRTLTNFGVKADVSYLSTRHNAKAGLQINQTNLMEDFTLGVTDPAFNAVCVDGAGAALADTTVIDPASCTSIGGRPNAALAPGLLAYDLTRGGSLFHFHGTAAIRTQGVFVQDTVTLRRWTVNLGLRFDRYDGLSDNTLWQPRLGVSYHVARTATVLRAGYARTLQSPLNENLILSSATGEGGLASNVFGASASLPLHAGRRDQVNLGLQQALGRRFSLDVDAFWKRTRNSGCDLDSLLNTAIFFPIEYARSSMDGYSARLTMAPLSGVTASVNVGHTVARVYTPEVGGLIFNAPLPGQVGLLDHDQKLQATAQIQYQPPRGLPWLALIWRYDSGVVAGAIPDLASLLSLSANDQQTVGFYCGSESATIASPIRSCSAVNYGTRFVNVPAEGTADEVTNPPRLKGRHLVDLALGMDNVLRSAGRVKMTARLSVLNLTDTAAMFNFLSTCAGTHFVPPRSIRVQVGVTF